MKKKPKHNNPYNEKCIPCISPHKSTKLVMLLSFTIFILLLIGNIITFFIFSMLYFKGKLPHTAIKSFSGFLFHLLFLSTIIGTVLSFLIGHIPLNPINQLIRNMTELSKGNFHVRMKTNLPGDFRNIAQNFNIMAESLESTEILRNDFISNFSHEFKTPIVSIRGFAKILKDNTLSESDRNEYLDIIISESSRLSSLANNVLNLSKIESQTVLTETTQFNLSEQIRKCVLMLENRWEEKNINLDIDLDEIFFRGNEELMTQVWINLLDNAIKFSPENGTIKLKLLADHSNLVFYITDSGSGIPPEQQKHIFDKFYQGDTSHSSAGNGLGLAVVKKIISLHHGKIIVNSIPDCGTTFTVFFPSI